MIRWFLLHLFPFLEIKGKSRQVAGRRNFLIHPIEIQAVNPDLKLTEFISRLFSGPGHCEMQIWHRDHGPGFLVFNLHRTLLPYIDRIYIYFGDGIRESAGNIRKSYATQHLNTDCRGALVGIAVGNMVWVCFSPRGGKIHLCGYEVEACFCAFISGFQKQIE